MSFICLNCNSLVGHDKRIALNFFLRKHKPSFMLLSETKLSPRHNMKFDGYSMIRTDQGNNNLGTAILIKDTFNHKEVHFGELNGTEYTAISINLGMSENLLVVSLYNRCTGVDLTPNLNTLANEANKYTYAVLGGDFNANHASWSNCNVNTNGKALHTWLTENINHELCMIAPNSPTRPSSGSTIDFFLISSRLVCTLPQLTNFTICTLPADSDHYAVQLNISSLSTRDVLTIAAPTFDSLKGVNWQNFRNSLSDKLNNEIPPADRDLSPDEIDHYVELFNTHTEATIKEFSKKVPAKEHKYGVLPTALRELFRHRRRLRKALKRCFNRTLNTTNPEYRSIIAQLKCTSTMIRTQTRNHMEEEFRKKLRAMQPGPDVFKHINNLCNRKPKPPATIQKDSVCLSDPQEKCDALAEHFQNSFKDNSALSDPNFVQDVNNSIDDFISETVEETCTTFNSGNLASNPENHTNFTSTTHISAIILSLKGKKSSGPDGIPNRVIKNFPSTALLFLTIIFNHCINKGYFPAPFKKAKIVPVPKKKNASNINDFRPISLISNVGKVFEKILLQLFEFHCSDNRLVQDNQFGFKKGHSTLHPLLILHTDAITALNKKECIVGCFLDVEKAFDSVWKNGLIRKMIQASFPNFLIKIMHSFLSNREFFVTLQKKVSDPKEILAGVPQGSILGPYLFNFFTHDIPTNEVRTKTLLYADDSLTYAASPSPVLAAKRVESHVAKLHDFYSKWGIKINANKSQLLCIRPTIRSKNAKGLEITINGHKIGLSKTVKYLGINFNEQLKFNFHARKVKSNTLAAYHSLSPILRKENALSEDTKLLIYKQLIRSCIGYNFSIWHTITPAVMSELEILERKVLRACTGLYRRVGGKYYHNETVYEQANIPLLRDFLFQGLVKQMGNIATHSNSLVSQLPNEFSRANLERLSPLLAVEAEHKNIYMDDQERLTFYDQKGSYVRG